MGIAVNDIYRSNHGIFCREFKKNINNKDKEREYRNSLVYNLEQNKA